MGTIISLVVHMEENKLSVSLIFSELTFLQRKVLIRNITFTVQTLKKGGHGGKSSQSQQ